MTTVLHPAHEVARLRMRDRLVAAIDRRNVDVTVRFYGCALPPPARDAHEDCIVCETGTTSHRSGICERCQIRIEADAPHAYAPGIIASFIERAEMRLLDGFARTYGENPCSRETWLEVAAVLRAREMGGAA